MRPCEGPVHGGTCWLDPRGSLGRLAGQTVSEYCPRQSVSQGARDRGHRGRMAAEMLVTGWLYRVGTWTAQHRRRVVVVWVVAVAILIGLAQNLGGEFSEEFGIPGTESYAAQELLEELLCGVGLRARNPELLAELPTQVLREPDQDGHRDHPHHNDTTAVLRSPRPHPIQPSRHEHLRCHASPVPTIAGTLRDALSRTVL